MNIRAGFIGKISVLLSVLAWKLLSAFSVNIRAGLKRESFGGINASE